MITQFKIFETIHNGVDLEKMKAGDYVIVSLRNELVNQLGISKDKYENKIGHLIRVRQHYNEIDIDFGDDDKFFGASIFIVKYWSPYKEELETFIASEKYNI